MKEVNSKNTLESICIKPYQLSILLILFIYGDSVIFENTPNDPQHGWLAYILASIGGFILLDVYLKIYKLNDLKSFPEVLKKCFGKYIGSLFSILYSLFFLCSASLVAYNYTACLIQTYYDFTPKWFVLLVLGAVIMYALFKGIKIIARTSEIFLWLIFISIIFISIIEINKMQIGNMFPIFAVDYYPVIKDAFYPFSLSFGVCVAFLILFPLSGNVKEIKKPLFKGMWIIGAILTFISVRTLLIMGGSMINHFVYAIVFSYSITDQVRVGILPISLIGLSVLIKVIVLLYASISITTSVFKIKKFSPVIIVSVITILVLSNFSFNTGISIREFFYSIWVYIIAAFAVLMPIIILIISLIKKYI